MSNPLRMTGEELLEEGVKRYGNKIHVRTGDSNLIVMSTKEFRIGPKMLFENKFEPKDQKDMDAKAQGVRRYHTWLIDQCVNKKNAHLIRALGLLVAMLREGTTITLNCPCSGEPCHGHIIRNWVLRTAAYKDFLKIHADLNLEAIVRDALTAPATVEEAQEMEEIEEMLKDENPEM